MADKCHICADTKFFTSITEHYRTIAEVEASESVKTDGLCREHRLGYYDHVGRGQGILDAYRSGQAAYERAQDGSTARETSVEVLATRNVPTGSVSARESADSWSKRAADVFERRSDNFRALASGSIDIPTLTPSEVVPISRPERLLDVLVNRRPIDGHSFEFIRQTVRTNNAAPVADDATKPTSVITAAPVTANVEVIAHLSEATPLRVIADHDNMRRFLSTEMSEGVLDALENQIINGNGSSPQLDGLLQTSNLTEVAFDTDIQTSLRSARTALQTIGERPSAWVINPGDAESLDLERESTEGGYLASGPGYENIFGNIPVVVSNSAPAATAFLADWSFVQLVVRENVTLAVDTAGVLFTKNQFVMRAEGRWQLAVLRPSAVAVITTATS